MTVGMGAEAVSAQFVIGTRGRAVRPYGIWWILDHARPYVIMKLSPVFDDLPRFLILIGREISDCT
jgi:hypothetical protein